MLIVFNQKPIHHHKGTSMAISLQDQLLNSGLIKKDKANKAKKEKYKQSKQQRNSKTTQTDEATLLAQKTLAEKQAKDRQLKTSQKPLFYVEVNHNIYILFFL
jgi:uncharacterized protein YaiL (DUF2058 family)